MIQRNPPSSLPPLSPSQTTPDPEKSEKLGKAERYVNRVVSKKTTETSPRGGRIVLIRLHIHSPKMSTHIQTYT